MINPVDSYIDDTQNKPYQTFDQARRRKAELRYQGYRVHIIKQEDGFHVMKKNIRLIDKQNHGK